MTSHDMTRAQVQTELQLQLLLQAASLGTAGLGLPFAAVGLSATLGIMRAKRNHESSIKHRSHVHKRNPKSTCAVPQHNKKTRNPHVLRQRRRRLVLLSPLPLQRPGERAKAVFTS